MRTGGDRRPGQQLALDGSETQVVMFDVVVDVETATSDDDDDVTDVEVVAVRSLAVLITLDDVTTHDVVVLTVDE